MRRPRPRRPAAEIRHKASIELNVAASTVELLQVVKPLLNYSVTLDDVPRLEPDYRLDLVSSELGIVFNLDLPGAILPAFINRDDDLQDIDGFEAVRLWRKYQRGDEQALKLLMKYNQADIENLKTLMDFAFDKLKNKHFYSVIQ